MKKLLVGAAFVALGTFSAQAADLAVRPHRTVEPAYNWSGIYIGANAGYTWSDHGVDLSPTSGDVPALISSTGQVPGSVT